MDNLSLNSIKRVFAWGRASDSYCYVYKPKDEHDLNKIFKEYDIPFYITNNSKIQKMYKWKPKKNISHIVEDLCSWMRSNKKLLKKYIL